MSEETENAIEYLKWSGKPKLASAVAALKEENERLMRLHADTCIKAGDEITTLKARVAELKEVLRLALEYWQHRQQRYKNRFPSWVVAAKEALKEPANEG